MLMKLFAFNELKNRYSDGENRGLSPLHLFLDFIGFLTFEVEKRLNP